MRNRLLAGKLFSFVQRSSDPLEIAALEDENAIPNRSSLMELDPFLNDNNLLSVGVRCK